MLGYFFFNPASVTLVPVAGIYSFCFFVWSRLYSRNLHFLSFLSFLLCSEDSAILVRGRAEVFSLADFASLGLDSLERNFFAVVPWVCIFKAVLLEGRWSLEQWISESWTMVLDRCPACVCALTALCTISSNFTDSWSCYSILTLMEDLRYSRK